MTTIVLSERVAECTMADLLADLRGGDDRRHAAIPTDSIRFDIAGERQVAFGPEHEPHTVPYSDTTLAAFAALCETPAAWLKKQPDDLTQLVLTRRIQEVVPPLLAVTWDRTGLHEIRDANYTPIGAVAVAEAVARVVGTGAEIYRLVNTAQMLSFDVCVPPDYDRAVGWNPDVLDRSDVATGGLRVAFNRVRNLTPAVQPWALRRPTGAGLEFPTPGLKVDARGKTSGEVVEEFEVMCDTAFTVVEDHIADLYRCAHTIVDDVSKALLVLSREQNLPDRTTGRLLAGAEMVEPTVLGLVEHTAELARDPKLKTDGTRLTLELAAGSLVADHSKRCDACKQRTL